MYKLVSKLAVVVATLFVVSGAQALPISGSVGFTANGAFINDGGGNPNGFDFFTSLAECQNAGLSSCSAPHISAISGDIATAYFAAGNPDLFVGPNPITVYDFDLSSLPSIEWDILPVKFGTEIGTLSFEITDGAAVDLSGGSNFDDLAGNGILSFNCTSNCGPSPVMDDTIGRWSISNSGSFSIVGFNVPAPASLGLLGLGLLGLGFARRRKAA